jgi:adenylate cyclase
MGRSRLLAAAVAGAIVFAAVMGLREASLLQGLELAIYDQYVRHASRSAEPPSRIAIVEVTEEDIREQGHWPLSDRTMTSALRALGEAGARVIGLDIYRDLPVPPGEARLGALLRSEPRIVAVRKFGDSDSEGIPGPPALSGTDRVGFNDILVDADGRVRRGLLFLDDGEGDVEYAFALRVALLALAHHGVRPAADPVRPEWLRLGPRTLRPWEGDDGGYSGEDDAGYQYLLNFPGAEHGFPSFRLGQLLGGELDPELLRDRIVLVGVNAKSLPDFFHVPFHRELETEKVGIPSRVAGIELHAHMVEQLVRFGLGESTPMRVLSGWQEALLIALLAAFGCAVGLGTRGSPILGVSAEVVGVLFGVAALWLAGAVAYRAGWWVPMVAPGLAWLSAAGVVTAWSSSRERAQRALLMQLFSRHVSSDVADEIWRQREEFFTQDGRPRSRRMTATVLFVDMKGYTAHAEKMDPEGLMGWVNDFMEAMARKVDEFGGVVDDYFGDGIKANFGVPLARDSEAEIEADARRAVDCALEMGVALGRLNAKYRERDLPTVAMRVGIHTGPVVAGSLGSAQRLKYTVVGDVVVTAQRLESLGGVEHDFERHPCRILISEGTQSYLDQSYRCEPLGPVSLKGKGEEVAVHRVLGRSGEPREIEPVKSLRRPGVAES